MNEDEIEILKSIYSRPNEIVYNPLTEILIYNAFDDRLRTIAFSVMIYGNQMIQIDSKLLTNQQVKQLQSQAWIKTDLFGLFVELNDIYQRMKIENNDQQKEIKENLFGILMQIDHMRSPNVYMKHLKNWTDEFEITGRVFSLSHAIFIFIEGINERLKVR